MCVRVCLDSQAVVRPQGADAVSVRLDALVGPSQGQLDGFKARALRAQAPEAQRHLYSTEWRSLMSSSSDAADVGVVVIGDESSAAERVSLGVVRSKLASEASGSLCAVVMAAVASQRGPLASLPLVALEVALVLVQTSATSGAPPPAVWLLTAATSTSHPGAWGLARSARAEETQPIACIDAPST